MIFLTLLYNALIWVFIIDIAEANKGILHPIIKAILKIPQNRAITVPLIDCSLCVVFWTGLILLLISGFSIEGLVAVCLCSYLTRPIGLVYNLITDIIIKIINKIYDVFNL